MHDYRMKFFTPELYMRFNSSDDDIADEATREWDRAIENYLRHLQSLPLTEHVKELSEQCFHDALCLDKTTHPGRSFPAAHPSRKGNNSEERDRTWITPQITSLLLQAADEMIQLLYSAAYDPVIVDHSPEWKAWEVTNRWLYDEIDVAEDEPRLFIHRILWSNGTVLTIPFWDVSLVRVPLDRMAGSEHSDFRGSRQTLPG